MYLVLILHLAQNTRLFIDTEGNLPTSEGLALDANPRVTVLGAVDGVAHDASQAGNPTMNHLKCLLSTTQGRRRSLWEVERKK